MSASPFGQGKGRDGLGPFQIQKVSPSFKIASPTSQVAAAGVIEAL